MFKKTNSDIINVTSHIIEKFPEEYRQNIVDEKTKKFQLTREFVIEFRQYITAEMFSKSPNLEMDLIKEFQELFDINYWKDAKNRNVGLLEDDTFLSMLDDETIDSVFSVIKDSELTERLFDKFIDKVSESTKKRMLAASSRFISNEKLVKYSKYLTASFILNPGSKVEWTEELVTSIIDANAGGIGLGIFLMLLTKITLLKDLHAILNNENIKLVLDGDDEMVEKSLFKLVSLIFDSEILDELLQMVKNIDPNIISIRILTSIIKGKDVSEEFYLSHSDLFINNGLGRILLGYAKNKRYDSLALQLMSNG